jgi:murein L,D-transpeptidase YcbB/YkuD
MNESLSHESHDSVGVRTVLAHRFFVMVILAILVSLFLVYVALSLYQSSGTLQLDLSRPGYDSARKEAIKDSQVFTGFSADGPINKDSLSQFDGLYKQEAADALINIDAFSGDALSDSTLTLDRD